MNEENEKNLHTEENSNGELTDEELQELVLAAQEEARLQREEADESPPPKPRFPKWIFWVMAVTLFFNTFAVIFQVYSIPAIDFLKASATLSTREDIRTYKKAVVNIQTGESKGTGFSISSDGTILTNYHVIEGYDEVVVTFPEEGRFVADVTNTYPEVDLAVVEVDGENFPTLNLSDNATYSENEPVYFIGNPLSFTGIANEGNLIGEKPLKDWQKPVMMMHAPVYRGNSGSPVINELGEVIGVVFATTQDETHGKVGLFVPIEAYFIRQ